MTRPYDRPAARAAGDTCGSPTRGPATVDAVPAVKTTSVAAASAAAALFAAAAIASGGVLNQPLPEPTDAAGDDNAGPGASAPDPAPE